MGREVVRSCGEDPVISHTFTSNCSGSLGGLSPHGKMQGAPLLTLPVQQTLEAAKRSPGRATNSTFTTGFACAALSQISPLTQNLSKKNLALDS